MRGDLTAQIGGVRSDLNTVRIDVMARIDRLQDAVSEQRDDISVPLDLLATHQRMAERGVTGARLAMDGLSSTNSAMTTMERQLRRLQDEVRQLKDKS